MSSSNIPQAQDSLEAIFAEIRDKLENVITKYRSVALQNEYEALRDKINDSCDELEELRETISDTNQGLTVRTQSVNNICDNIDDIILDIDNFLNSGKTQTRSEKVITTFNDLKILVGMRDPEIPALGVERRQPLQDNNENYFLAKKAEINAILAANPELNTD
jgi:ElaB/YqjD/DUF883 family membrane-anchored ribosome-binding protein